MKNTDSRRARFSGGSARGCFSEIAQNCLDAARDGCRPHSGMDHVAPLVIAGLAIALVGWAIMVLTWRNGQRRLREGRRRVFRPQSDHEREDPVEPPAAKIPDYLADRLAPLSRDPVVIFGGHLLQLIGAIAIIYVVLHFLYKYW
jgi:hypothetical protein